MNFFQVEKFPETFARKDRVWVHLSGFDGSKEEDGQMSNTQSCKIGVRVAMTGTATAPDLSSVVKESMHFLRDRAGCVVVPLTPIDKGTPKTWSYRKVGSFCRLQNELWIGAD